MTTDEPTELRLTLADEEDRDRDRDWSTVPWTPFEECALTETDRMGANVPVGRVMNSRYQVTLYVDQIEMAGDRLMPFMHLSIKTHNKQAWHDWRDLQRIKTAICGPDCEGIELFPAEERVVDTSNQYHLYVGPPGFRFPFGFRSGRVITDCEWTNPEGGRTRQRPYKPGERPDGAMDEAAYHAWIRQAVEHGKQTKTYPPGTKVFGVQG